jgi:DNA-binding transcriptional ArsR family regulator
MKHLLSSSAFLVLNKQLAKQIGLKPSILLADLISKEEYFIANGMTDGWFFNTESNIQDDTTLTPFQQRNALKVLKEKGLIETQRRGIPAKQYFKINEQQVIHFLNNLSEIKLTTINNNKEIKIKNKYFKKPSVSEIVFYSKQKEYKIDAEAFYDFYESKNWMVGKNKMKDWKAAVRTWQRRETSKPKTMSKLDAQVSAWQEAKKLL